MSRMSELAQTLDDLTEVGQRLMACGEDLIKAAARVKDCFSGEDESEQEKPKTAGRRRAAKESESEPAEETASEAPMPKVYTKEEVRALLAELSQSGYREDAKALVKKYAEGGSLTDIDPARYPDLVEEVHSIHG